METVAIEILRTPELQRLRKIKQTGLVHLVFPESEHSRLVHCLGAAHLAIRFARHLREATKDYLADSLRPNEASIRDLSVAALCHDLGHGPLSHAWEREIIGKNFDLNKWANELGLSNKRSSLQGIKWHELVGQALLAWEDGQLFKLLEQHERGFSKRLRYLLKGKYYLSYFPRLLSSDVDVDRADYLIRDSHQTGVTFGWYDLDRLISTCTVGEYNGSLVVGFDEKKAPRVIEQYLIARRALHENVYFHKTVRAAEGMVGLFLKHLKEEMKNNPKQIKFPFLDPLVKMISGDVVGPQQLLSLDDYSLWILIEYVANDKNIDRTVCELAQRILSRDLFKEVPCNSDRIDEFLIEDEGRSKLYNVIQPYCTGKAECYLLVDTIEFDILNKK